MWRKGLRLVYKFDKVISLWKMEAHLSEPVMYDVNYDTKEILIYTTRPGWLIGKAGCLVNKYTEVMKKEWPILMVLDSRRLGTGFIEESLLWQ